MRFALVVHGGRPTESAGRLVGVRDTISGGDAILQWLAGRDVVPLNGLVLLQVQHCARGEFGAVVA